MLLNETETFDGKNIIMVIVLEDVFPGHLGECRKHFIVLRCSYFEGAEELHLGERIQCTSCSFHVLLNRYFHRLCYLPILCLMDILCLCSSGRSE
jgi:DNA-directed RNA polymerase subunit RPC12/RpoP